MTVDWDGFIRTNTRILRPPLVPEIELHLAEESLPIWRKTEEELGEIGLPPPYWAFAWAGGQALARYVLDTPELVAGRTVLDLGSGSGLSAIAAARAGAGHVTGADIDPIARRVIALNARRNSVEIECSAADVLAGPPAAVDVILIGDLYYERPLAERVTAFVAGAAAAGTLVLAGDPRRSYFPEVLFTRIAEYAVPVTRELEDAEIKRTAVWRLIDRRRT